MINYLNIHESVEHYAKLGYQRVETPWMVSSAVSSMTKPPHGTDFDQGAKVLVASGEQSFLYQYAKGALPPGTFQTVTPCFRREEYDATHQKYFLKNELINTADVDELTMWNMVEHARAFFNAWLPSSLVSVVNTGYQACDIVCTLNGTDYELGSYGIRENEMLQWVYGTGCAEPRLSFVQQLVRR
jgi:hypothetical protein